MRNHFPMNLREAFLVFLSLLVMAILNAGLLWEGQRISYQYTCLELMDMLELNESQIEEIGSIQAAYETEILRVANESGSTSEKIIVLKRERSRLVMEVLTEQQRRKLQVYCTDLVSLGKTVE